MAYFTPLYDTLPAHPKLARLAATLGIDPLMAIGHLVCLWTWALEYAEDGNLGKYTDAEIAQAAKWPDEPGALVDALVGAKFLDWDEDGHAAIHQWDQYGGMIIRRKKHDNEGRMARKQAEKVKNAPTPPDPSSGPPAQNRTVQNSTSHNTTTKKPTTKKPATAAASPRPDERPPARRVSPLTPEQVPRFDLFWATYPPKRKVDKPAAERAWMKINPDDQLTAVILSGVISHAQGAQWRKGVQWIPHPATFLNGERWNDPVDEGDDAIESKGGPNGQARTTGRPAPHLFGSQPDYGPPGPMYPDPKP